MTRTWTRLLLLLALVVCLTAVAVPPASAFCIHPCTTEGEVAFFQDGCCPPLAFGPTVRNLEYVCHSGCYQATTKTQCTNDPCV